MRPTIWFCLIPLCLVALCLGRPVRADVVPAPLFSDNAVLQRDKPIPVWGTADAGEKVSVAFAGHTVATTADATGRWRVVLPALPASAKPAALVIKGKNTCTFRNIVVGEVWLASGQSNMELPVKDTYEAALDIPGSARFPLVREIRVGYKVSDTPLTTGSGAWEVAGPAATGQFSAVGYYFARALHETLDVPVGIIHSSRGASVIKAWMDPAALRSDPASRASPRHGPRRSPATPRGKRNSTPKSPSGKRRRRQRGPRTGPSPRPAPPKAGPASRAARTIKACPPASSTG